VSNELHEAAVQWARKLYDLADVMPDQRLEIPEIGVFERHKGKDRKAWKHDELYSRLLRIIRAGGAKQIDQKTGEIVDEDATEQAFRVLAECARPEWRVTALRKLDLDPDEYCEVKPGRVSVQFIGELS
jgi:hypothetical protein